MVPYDGCAQRCFVTAVEVEKPSVNRLQSIVRCRVDNGGLECSFHAVDGSKFFVGQVIWLTVSLKGD